MLSSQNQPTSHPQTTKTTKKIVKFFHSSHGWRPLEESQGYVSSRPIDAMKKANILYTHREMVETECSDGTFRNVSHSYTWNRDQCAFTRIDDYDMIHYADNPPVDPERWVVCPACDGNGCDQCPPDGDGGTWLPIIERGSYDEIILASLHHTEKEAITDLIRDIQAGADEHGGWEFGCEFDRKGRGSAVNWDCYGFDGKGRNFLAIIQVREAKRTYAKERGGFLNIRKSYFLCGYNEDHSAFAHPVESQVVRRNCKTENNPSAVVWAVQKWIWGGVDPFSVRRQGDLACIPLKRKPAGDVAPVKTCLIEGSHLLQADMIITHQKNKKCYALNPQLTHQPGTHPGLILQGWHRIKIGMRAKCWDFAPPTAD